MGELRRACGGQKEKGPRNRAGASGPSEIASRGEETRMLGKNSSAGRALIYINSGFGLRYARYARPCSVI